MEITKEQYDKAIEQKAEADRIISEYYVQRSKRFQKRLQENPIFAAEELVFAATSRCSCGAGLAYPKECNSGHYWDCSEILMGIAKKEVKHTDQLPFAYYEVKFENQPSANGMTTRPK